jgi:hypothetical protein
MESALLHRFTEIANMPETGSFEEVLTVPQEPITKETKTSITRFTRSLLNRTEPNYCLLYAGYCKTTGSILSTPSTKIDHHRYVFAEKTLTGIAMQLVSGSMKKTPCLL